MAGQSSRGFSFLTDRWYVGQMTYRQAMRALKSCGTAQNCKTYARHGVGERMFGVSFANLKRLTKQIKTDHGLAMGLWSSGNHDARILATMVADPSAATVTLLEAWKTDLNNYVVTDAFSIFVAATPLARTRMEKWTRSPREWVGRAGWLVLAHIARNTENLRDEYFGAFLPLIEQRIHGSKNRTRDAMNSALIGIGIRGGRLESNAIAAARRIGKVEVDHGETSCKTPDAEAYIRKAKARKTAT